MNQLETLTSLILQTLRLSALRAFLPADAISSSAGRHLNIAIPLIQSSRLAKDSLLYSEMFHDSDPVSQAYFQLMRNDFNALKYSSVPCEREYYAKTMTEAAEKRTITKQAAIPSQILNGQWIPVRKSYNPRGDHYQFNFWYLTCEVPRGMAHLSDVSQVWARAELTEVGKVNDKRYTLKCKHTDPAARLAICIKGVDENDDGFEGYLPLNQRYGKDPSRELSGGYARRLEVG